MGTMHIINPDGVVVKRSCPDKYNLNEFYNPLKTYVGGELEFVKVIFNGKDSWAVVHELGAVMELTINEEGTLMYHTRLAQAHNTSPENISRFSGKIHGTIVVLEDVTID